MHAQQATPVADLQEVTVQSEKYRPDDQTTATGLRLKLIDTPQSISVVTDEMLKLFNEQSAYEAADMVPGLSQGGEGFGLTELYIRGQELKQPRINGINLMGEQYVDSFALDRLEVVRGPATVLYGVTGAFGGEINQVLKKPKDDYSANFGYQAGDFASRRFEGDVTGPVPGTDGKLKVRFVGAYTDAGIPQDVVIPRNNVSRLMSAAVTYDFTPATSASVYLYKEDKSFDPQDGCPLAQTPDNTLYIPPVAVDHWYCNDPKQSFSTRTNELEYAAVSQTFANQWILQADAAHTDFVRTSDYVFSFGPAGAFALPPTDAYLYGYRDREQQNVVTSDLSLAGKFDLLERTQQFFAAFEYQKQEYHRFHFQSFGLGTINMFQEGGQGILADGTPIPLIPPAVYTSDQINYNTAYRGSIQLLLNPLERLDVLAGLLVQNTDLQALDVKVVGTSTSAELKETDYIKRLGVTYGLVKDKSAALSDAKTYFSYSEGVQPNVGIYDAAGNPLTDPQSMRSFEVGLKTEWLNGSLNASVAAYHSYVTNVPTTIFTQIGTANGSFSSVLGGKNTYDGAELEVLGEIVPGWNVDLSFSHIKALVESLLLTQKLEVANVPENQGSLYTSYEVLHGPLKGLIVGGALVVKDHVPLVDSAPTIFSSHYDPSNNVPWSATRFDFRASYKGFTGFLKGLEVHGNVYNAFNSRSYFSISGEPGFTNLVGPPRTLSVGLRYSF